MMDPFFPGDCGNGARTGNQHATIEDVRKNALIKVLADNLNMMFDIQLHDLCVPLILAPVSVFSRLRGAENPEKSVRTSAFFASSRLSSAKVDRTAQRAAKADTIDV